MSAFLFDAAKHVYKDEDHDFCYIAFSDLYPTGYSILQNARNIAENGCTVAIKGGGKEISVNYLSNVTLHSNCHKVASGNKIQWVLNGTVVGEGDTYVINQIRENTEMKVIVVNADGEKVVESIRTYVIPKTNIFSMVYGIILTIIGLNDFDLT